MKAIPPSAWVVALDEHGERWGTADLARRLADQRWSLSPLTLLHALVRVTLAEQI